MNLIPLLALTQKPDTSVMDALPHLVGMLMVFATLAILWGVCALSAKLIQVFLPEPALKPATIKPTPLPVVQSGVEDAGTPPEIIAAIAAAVACFTGPSHRIVSIRCQSTSWEKAGRQSVLTSHKIR
jgi:Na+-transporting methylmalonyl-CoA/oxaloacetate decarboxylase gamma subunit